MSLSRNNYTSVTSISEINGTIGVFCGHYRIRNRLSKY